MTLQVRKCCEDIPLNDYEVLKDNSIRFDNDPEYGTSYDDVKYCMYCGNRLQLELKPETAQPSKPDLSSLSAKDRALEELKEEMQK